MEIWEQSIIIYQSQLILNNFYHWFGYPLLDVNDETFAHQLFEASFPVFSHTDQTDPIYNYGNRKALELWELEWEQPIKTPSRYSAEPMEQADRSRLLEETMKQGYCCHAQGVRISSTGKRYNITDFAVWNLLDEHRQCRGQAATFSKWMMINT